MDSVTKHIRRQPGGRIDICYPVARPAPCGNIGVDLPCPADFLRAVRTDGNAEIIDMRAAEPIAQERKEPPERKTGLLSGLCFVVNVVRSQMYDDVFRSYAGKSLFRKDFPIVCRR